MTEDRRVRGNVAKRLKRRNILSTIKGVSTDELLELWEKYRDEPTVKQARPRARLTNYETVVNILESFTENFKDFFIGWYKDAWRYLPEIEYFWQRIDEDAINNDESFIPREINIYMLPPSDWGVDEHFQMAPEDMPDYLKKIFDKYLL